MNIEFDTLRPILEATMGRSLMESAILKAENEELSKQLRALAKAFQEMQEKAETDILDETSKEE